MTNLGIVITINDEEFQICKDHALKMARGGISRIRNEEERKKFLLSDQLLSQVGEAALCKFYNGNINLYNRTRVRREETPWLGDGGIDLLGTNDDIKTSLMSRGRNFIYHLWVSIDEFHPDRCYTLGLVEPNRLQVVYLVGWVLGRFMGKGTDPRGNIRYACPMNKLNPMFTGW